MARCWLSVFVLLALCRAPALGQPLFFDDFDGNALLPHWNVPPPSHWEYNVSNSMLNVTGLFFPSSPKSSSNWAFLSAALSAPTTDFQADVWMGWDAGQAPHRLQFDMLTGPGNGGHIASMGYDPFLGGVYAGTGGQGVIIPAPPPGGIHHFSMNRTGSQFNFYFNGTPFASLQGSTFPAAGLQFEFFGPYPGQLGAFHIDRVLVVPAPSAMLLLSALALLVTKPRRR